MKNLSNCNDCVLSSSEENSETLQKPSANFILVVINGWILIFCVFGKRLGHVWGVPELGRLPLKQRLRFEF